MNAPLPSSDGIAISFCTTCHNRAEQLVATFHRNSRVVAECPAVEWIIVDFSSTDGISEFLGKTLPTVSRRISCSRTVTPLPWHMSVAKNTAHREARGNILVNLDCDNFIGDAVDVVSRFFSEGCKVLHMWSGTHRDGTCGRIALDRQAFYDIGGYDEGFHPMGYEDIDLLKRARAAGYPLLKYASRSIDAIPNTKELSVKYCAVGNLRWEDLERENRMRSSANIAAGRLRCEMSKGSPVPIVSRTRGGLND